MEAWRQWRRTHYVAREILDALVLTATSVFAWLVIGPTAGEIFAGISLSLIVFGVLLAVIQHRAGRAA